MKPGKIKNFSMILPGSFIDHPLRETSVWARQSIAITLAEVSTGERPAGGITDDWKRERRRWMDPINEGTQGYIIAWALKLGGWLD